MKYSINTATLCCGMLAATLAVAEQDGASRDVDTAEVEEIVVRERQLAIDSASISVKLEPALDTAEVLRRLPGADANRNGPLTGIAQYRGMYGDRVAVSIDGLGVISGGPNAMDAPLSYVSPMITEQLILERGVPGVASSPEAIGGHVEAQLARGSFGSSAAFELAGMAGLRYADNGNTSSSAGRLTLANESHRFSLVGQLDRGDDQKTPVGKIVPSGVERDRFDASYAFSSPDTDFQVFAGGLDTRDTGTPALAMDIIYIDSVLYGFNVGHRLNDTSRIALRVGYNDVDHVMNNFGLRPAPDSPMQYRQNRATGSGTVFALSAEFDVGMLQITTGVDGRLASHDSLITNPNNPAFFVQNFNDIERDILGGWVAMGKDSETDSWEFGLRYNHVSGSAGEVGTGGMMGMMAMNAGELADAFNAADRELTFDNVDAVFKYAYRLNADLELSLDLGSRARAPSHQELYLWLPLQATGGLADGRNYVGNLALDAERSNEIALGMDWTVGGFRMTPQVFYRDVSDYIQGVPTDVMAANMIAGMMSGNPALQFDNVEAELYGVDLGWSYALGRTLSLDGTLSFTRGKRTDLTDDLYRLPPLNGSVALTFAEDDWTVRGEIVAYDDQDKVSSYNGELPTSGYGIVNALLAWRPSEAVRLELAANNLFDKGYQDHLAGVNRVRNVDIPVGERLWGAERTITVGAVLTFQ